MAGDRHGLPCPLAFQRRPGSEIMRSQDPAPVTATLRNSQLKPAGLDRQDRQAAPGQAAWWHAAKAVVRQHWLAVALLTVGLVLRVLAQFAYRPALFYIDTSRYLLNVAPGMDPVGYEGPLRAILLVSNFDAVAAVQHVLSLAMAMVIYLLLRRRGAA